MKTKIINILKIVFAVGLVTAIIINYDFLSNLDIRALIRSADSMTSAALIIFGVYILKSVVFVVPASLIYLSVGMAFDPIPAIIINTVGIMLEITTTYIMGKIMGKDAVKKRLSGTKPGEKLLNMKSKSKNLMIFTIRFTGIPIDFSSLFMGAFDFKFVPYFFISLLGILPRVIPLTIAGDTFYRFIPTKYIITAVLIIIPLAGIALAIKAYTSKRKTKSSTNNR